MRGDRPECILEAVRPAARIPSLVTVILLGVLAACQGGEGKSATPEEGRGPAPFESAPGAATLVPEADPARLFAAARQALERYGIAREDVDAGRLESRDFYRKIDGLAVFSYVEIQISEMGRQLPQRRVEVRAHDFERIGDDGTPFSESTTERFRYTGPDRELQESILDELLAAYGQPRR